jgi:very-short-patch-repair endonuclease
VYAVGHRAVGLNGRRLAAVRACGPGALLSHRSAADAWGIRRSASARTDVLTTARGRNPPPGISLHTTRSLHPDDVAELDGIPITSVARTIVDFAASATGHDVERAVHEAEVRRILDTREVQAVLDRSHGRARTQHVRAAIAKRSPGRTHPGLEDEFLALCRRHAIETPSLNASLSTTLGPMEVDAYWPAHHLIVELDGGATHLTWRAFEEDRRRDAALVEHGFRVIRLTWARVTDDEPGVARQLRRLLHRG